jgi:hypothetical protein
MACEGRMPRSGTRRRDTLAAHTQASGRFAHGDSAFASMLAAGFQPYDTRLLQLQFGGVFAGDDASCHA